MVGGMTATVAQPPEATELYDRDGELWWRDGNGDRWYLLGDYFMPRTLAEINRNYGPLTKVA